MEKRDELIENIARVIHESARRVIAENKAIAKTPGKFIEWKDLTDEQKQGKRMMAEDVVNVFFPVAKVNDFSGIDHDFVTSIGSSVLFNIQDGAIKLYGVNGCQVDEMIRVSREIIALFDNRFPCEENKDAMSHLNAAMASLRRRKSNREARGVEGKDER